MAAVCYYSLELFQKLGSLCHQYGTRRRCQRPSLNTWLLDLFEHANSAMHFFILLSVSALMHSKHGVRGICSFWSVAVWPHLNEVLCKHLKGWTFYVIMVTFRWSRRQWFLLDEAIMMPGVFLSQYFQHKYPFVTNQTTKSSTGRDCLLVYGVMIVVQTKCLLSSFSYHATTSYSLHVYV